MAGASEHVLEQSDYYAFGERIEVSGQAFDQTNRYRYNGKEQLRFESLNLDPGLTDYGARYYAPAFGRWASPDPLADKYYSVSPYAFCNNNPVNFIDPDGMSTWVVANPDGTYTVEGGDLDDNDLNIYVVAYDEEGNMTIGESIGRTTSITSFYNSDLDQNNEEKGWQVGAIINPSDMSGINFMSDLIQENPDLKSYITHARTGHKYDFKVTNGTDKVTTNSIYRGMPIGIESGEIIFTSARDIGNIMAGYVAGRKGLTWGMARLGFDTYQMWSNIKRGDAPKRETRSSRNAQYWGWQRGKNY